MSGDRPHFHRIRTGPNSTTWVADDTELEKPPTEAVKLTRTDGGPECPPA